MKIAALIGEPATGKSTIARTLVEGLSLSVPFKQGLVFGTHHPRDRVIVFGNYPIGEIYGGTDRFSMAAQPSAISYLQQLQEDPHNWSVFFEGDRLGTLTFLKFCKEIAGEFRLFKTEVRESIIQQRHIDRRDTQSETFLKGRKTKISNIATALPTNLIRNESSEDLLEAASTIRKFLTSV